MPGYFREDRGPQVGGVWGWPANPPIQDPGLENVSELPESAFLPGLPLPSHCPGCRLARPCVPTPACGSGSWVRVREAQSPANLVGSAVQACACISVPRPSPPFTPVPHQGPGNTST